MNKLYKENQIKVLQNLSVYISSLKGEKFIPNIKNIQVTFKQLAKLKRNSNYRILMDFNMIICREENYKDKTIIISFPESVFNFLRKKEIQKPYLVYIHDPKNIPHSWLCLTEVGKYLDSKEKLIGFPLKEKWSKVFSYTSKYGNHISTKKEDRSQRTFSLV